MATRDPYEQHGGGRRNEAYSSSDEGQTNQYPQNSANNVITRQPKQSGTDQSVTPNATAHAGNSGNSEKEWWDKEGPSAEIEVNLTDPDGCVSASSGVGSRSIDCCDGLTNLECIGPNVGCVLSSNCEDGPTIVMDCTFEICSADCLILKLLFCNLGLAFDTKVTWAEEEAAFEVLGTGIDTSEGFAIGALGTKIGYGNEEKREKKLKKKRKE